MSSSNRKNIEEFILPYREANTNIMARMARKLRPYFTFKFEEKYLDKGLIDRKIPQIWKNHKLSGSGIKIAILDTGLDSQHEDFNIPIAKRNFLIESSSASKEAIENVNDINGHGTHVAGIIAALKNKKNYTGIAFDSSLMIGKVSNKGDGIKPETLVKGIKWAVANGAHILSLSLSSDINYQIVEEAIQEAMNKGVIVVCAAGEDKDYVQYPGKYNRVITVGMSDGEYTAVGTPKGPEIDLIAPGERVKSAYRINRAKTLNGTSMSTPFVAGVIALYLEKYWNELDNIQRSKKHDFVRKLLIDSTRVDGRDRIDDAYGYGIINPVKFINTKPLKDD